MKRLHKSYAPFPFKRVIKCTNDGFKSLEVLLVVNTSLFPNAHDPTQALGFCAGAISKHCNGGATVCTNSEMTGEKLLKMANCSVFQTSSTSIFFHAKYVHSQQHTHSNTHIHTHWQENTAKQVRQNYCILGNRLGALNGCWAKQFHILRSLLFCQVHNVICQIEKRKAFPNRCCQ